MESYCTFFSDRVKEVLDAHKSAPNLIEDTKKFVYAMLDPTPERGDMLYRYEHSIRAAENAKVIARAEKLPEEPLVLACLLHDVGYRECADDWGRHPFVSADIARVYLQNINYDPDMTAEMVRGIARHNLTDDIPADMTTFQMSIRDCDDIDRFDIIRTAMVMGGTVFEKTNVEIIESCEEAISNAKWLMNLPRGTKTAEILLKNNLNKRIDLLNEIITQARKGF